MQSENAYPIGDAEAAEWSTALGSGAINQRFHASIDAMTAPQRDLDSQPAENWARVVHLEARLIHSPAPPRRATNCGRRKIVSDSLAIVRYNVIQLRDAAERPSFVQNWEATNKERRNDGSSRTMARRAFDRDRHTG
jgi:hypothetical protein